MKLAFTALLMSLVVTPALAQRCKFEVEESSHLESAYFLMFRGGSVGLAAHVGIREGEGYLRDRYASQFRARAEFAMATPLELTLDSGEVMTLNVISEDRARLTFFGAAFANREAEPIYALSPAEMQTLSNSLITELTLSFVADGERRSTTREVKPKHAERIASAVRCVAGGVQ
jgi:hypothetical protein